MAVPILKPYKVKPGPLSHRPIALTSNMFKFMERLVMICISWYMGCNKLFNINQSKFQKRRNTLDRLFRVSDDILKGVAITVYVFRVLFDIETFCF